VREVVFDVTPEPWLSGVLTAVVGSELARSDGTPVDIDEERFLFWRDWPE
jgi:hypothetical protein